VRKEKSNILKRIKRIKMFSVEISNINEVLNQVDKTFDKYSRTLDKATGEVAEMSINHFKDNILEGRNFKGGKLKSNRLATIKSKGFDFPLVRTSAMVKGITKSAIPDGYEVYMGDKPFIARIQQSGYSFKARNGRMITVIARPFFGIGNLFKKRLTTFVNVLFKK
jgi:hypothetical protein